MHHVGCTCCSRWCNAYLRCRCCGGKRDRNMYVVHQPDDRGPPTNIKQYDTISNNMMIANYGSQEAIDNDDGSGFCEPFCHHGPFSWTAYKRPSRFSFFFYILILEWRWFFISACLCNTVSSLSPPPVAHPPSCRWCRLVDLGRMTHGLQSTRTTIFSCTATTARRPTWQDTITSTPT